MDIELSNGIAIIGKVWKWKHEKKYLSVLSSSSELTGEAFVKSKIVMVTCLLDQLTIDGTDTAVDEKNLDELSICDFETLYNACEKIRDESIPKKEEKKS